MHTGGSDDSLIRSSLAEREAMISGLNLTPSVTDNLRRYVSNLYTVAWAFDAAKSALPQSNNWEYLFTRGTIDLLQTNSRMSGDVLALYSGRETIQEAIDYLSGAMTSTISSTKQKMSQHNLSVALASQIGVEVLLCTKSYDALAQGRQNISFLFSWVRASYQRQLTLLGSLNTNDQALSQCLATYRQTLMSNIQSIDTNKPMLEKLTSIATSRQKAYTSDPLQCPIGIDLKNDIITVRGFESQVKELALTNSVLENLFLTGNLTNIQEACQAATQGTGGNNLEDLLSAFTGTNQELYKPSTGNTTNTWSYQDLPEDTQKIINDIYQKNIQYIQTMQTAEQNNNYRPLQRLQQLFKEFYGDTSEFIK